MAGNPRNVLGVLDDLLARMETEEGRAQEILRNLKYFRREFSSRNAQGPLLR